MIISFKKLILSLILILISLFYLGCGRATAPSFPSEVPIPAVLKLVGYDQLSVDLSAITSPTSLLADVSKAALTPSDVSLIIQGGPLYNKVFVEGFFKKAIDGINEINIPVDPFKTTYKIDMIFSVEAGILAGFHNVKIDFANFDFNNSGSADDEHCSGNTATLPVCVRLWLGGAPFIAGVIEEYPNSEIENPTIGKGRFKMRVQNFEGYKSLFAYNYEQIAADGSKNVEYFFKTEKVPSSPYSIADFYEFFDFELWNWHSQIFQIGPSDAAFKGLNLNSVLFLANPLGGLGVGEVDSKYIGQYVEGHESWSGSEVNQFVGSGGVLDLSPPVTNLCARLTDFIQLDEGECSNVGGYDIRVDDKPFVELLQDSDVAFPIDFPSTPTF